MRLSETRQPRQEWASPATRAARRKRQALWWKAGLSVGLLALVVGIVGAFGVSHHLVTRAAAAVNQDCTLVVPAHPLTAQGLATPYQLTATDPGNGPCHEANAMQAAFVQAAVYDPATGQVSVYDPLVTDQGTPPAIPPVVPRLPARAIVAIWFGFNGNALRLEGASGTTLQEANCVNGLGDSLFGQVAYCNAPAFFQAANAAVANGALVVPRLGLGRDGQTCPSVRSFALVDQDPSDNVTTTYLVNRQGQTAQNTPANRATLRGAGVLTNGSDNGLLTQAVDVALGCTPFMAPDLASPGSMASALPLDELQAAAHQPAPAATVPARDPMVLVNGNPDLAKQNLYRQGVDQAPIPNAMVAQQQEVSFCRNVLATQPARIFDDKPLTRNRPSPDPAAANNLFTFLAQRFNFTFGPNGLNCSGLLNRPSPIVLTQDSNGVTVNATLNLSSYDGPNGAPTCLVNGVSLSGCMGTATINGQSCAFAYAADTRQVTVTCPAGQP